MLPHLFVYCATIEYDPSSVFREYLILILRKPLSCFLLYRTAFVGEKTKRYYCQTKPPDILILRILFMCGSYTTAKPEFNRICRSGERKLDEVIGELRTAKDNILF